MAVGLAADQYALGVVICEMLAGELPARRVVSEPHACLWPASGRMSDFNLIQCVDRFLLTRVATNDEDLRRTRHVPVQFADMLAPKRFHPDEVLAKPTELG